MAKAVTEPSEDTGGMSILLGVHAQDDEGAFGSGLGTNEIG